MLVFLAPQQTAGDIEDILQEIVDYQVDAIIVLASVALSSQLATRCRAAGIPVVLFNRSQDGPPLPTVTSDNFSGGRASRAVPRSPATTAESATSPAGRARRRNAIERRGSGPGCSEAGIGTLCARGRRLPLRAGAGGRPPDVRAARIGPTRCSSPTTTWRSRPWTCCDSSSASRIPERRLRRRVRRRSRQPRGRPMISPPCVRRRRRWWRKPCGLLIANIDEPRHPAAHSACLPARLDTRAGRRACHEGWHPVERIRPEDSRTSRTTSWA